MCSPTWVNLDEGEILHVGLVRIWICERLQVFWGHKKYLLDLQQALGTGNAQLFWSHLSIIALKHPEPKSLGIGGYQQVVMMQLAFYQSLPTTLGCILIFDKLPIWHSYLYVQHFAIFIHYRCQNRNSLS